MALGCVSVVTRKRSRVDDQKTFSELAKFYGRSPTRIIAPDYTSYLLHLLREPQFKLPRRD
jgi:hypothetical protein